MSNGVLLWNPFSRWIGMESVFTMSLDWTLAPGPHCKRSLEKAFDSDPVSDREGGNVNVPLRSMTGTSRTFSISKGDSDIFRFIEVPLCNSLLTVTIWLDCCPCAWPLF